MPGRVPDISRIPEPPEISQTSEFSKVPGVPGPPALILASRSPRRAALLRDAGLRFEQADPPFADPDQPEPVRVADPERFAADLALQKARSLAESLRKTPQENFGEMIEKYSEGGGVFETSGGTGVLILAADTLCVSADGTLLGKPRDRADLLTMLAGFVSARHHVVTGVALLQLLRSSPKSRSSSRETLLADTAVVTWGDVPLPDREAYADTDTWRGKAGGYNLHDRQRAGWPITVAGDPATVTGLPMQKLLPVLRRLGITPRPPNQNPATTSSVPTYPPRHPND